MSRLPTVRPREAVAAPFTHVLNPEAPIEHSHFRTVTGQELLSWSADMPDEPGIPFCRTDLG